jgi:hypothetical protein
MKSKRIDGKPYKRHCLTLQPWDVKFKSIVVRKKNIGCKSTNNYNSCLGQMAYHP